MHRGSTPVYLFEFNISLAQLTKMNVVFAQNDAIKFEKSLEDVELVDDNKIKIELTEDETLLFATDKLKNAYVDVQFKFGFSDKRAISDITQIIIKPIIKEGKMTSGTNQD